MTQIRIFYNNRTELGYIILFLSIWLNPTQYLFEYIIFLCASLLVFQRQTKFILSEEAKKVLGFIAFLFLAATIRFFIFVEPLFRDFYEIGRFIPVLLIFGFGRKWENCCFDYLFKAVFIYLLLNTIITYSFNVSSGNPAMLSIQSIYTSSYHIEGGLLSHRACGLSSGPGQHSTMMVFCLAICLVSLYYHRRMILSNIAIMMCLYGLISSQSRTGFIAVVFIIAFIVFHEFLRGDVSRKRLSLFVLAIISANTVLISEFIMSKGYLMRLFYQGTETSSYYAREDKWVDIFNVMTEKPFLIIIGYGKDFFGMTSRAMDNEYIYIISVYGAILGILLLSLISVFLVKRVINWKHTTNCIWFVLIFYIVIAGLPLSWATSYWLDPRVLYTGAIIMSLYMSSKRRKVYKTS